MAFVLPELGFDYDDLEPYIDRRTMEIHHTQYHHGYMDKLNKAIEYSELESKSLSEILSQVSKYPQAIRNNGGGFYNHKLFWRILNPNSQTYPGKELADAIKKQFGSLKNMQEEFSGQALSLFGAGWVWLVKQDNGQLAVSSTQNQDNPLMDIVEVKGTPILCLDLWEHAYYLKYENNRADYVLAFWNLVNWETVTDFFINY
jgi:Fe-Mn family superoxide dismutase